MSTRRSILMLFLVMATSLGLCVSAPAVQASDAKARLVLIVATNSSLKEISVRDIKRIYSGEYVSGADGQKILPFNLAAASPDRVAFDSKVLGFTPSQVSAYWIDRKIRGQSGPPRSIESSATMQQVVAKLKNSIGYARASNVIDKSVRTLRINGKSATDPGYPLD